jgi:hypothetical protein
MSVREIMSKISLSGGQGFVHCQCKKRNCKSSRCTCRRSKAMCNSRCHMSLSCSGICSKLNLISTHISFYLSNFSTNLIATMFIYIRHYTFYVSLVGMAPINRRNWPPVNSSENFSEIANIDIKRARKRALSGQQVQADSLTKKTKTKLTILSMRDNVIIPIHSSFINTA